MFWLPHRAPQISEWRASGNTFPGRDRQSTSGNTEKKRGDSRLAGTTGNSAGAIRAGGSKVHNHRHADDAPDCNHGLTNDA
jgi:hypothetical protein